MKYDFCCFIYDFYVFSTNLSISDILCFVEKIIKAKIIII
jgi:hypothetical protein